MKRATVSTKKAAEMLDVTRRRVLAMIKDGKLETVQIGDEHAVFVDSIEAAKERQVQRRAAHDRRQAMLAACAERRATRQAAEAGTGEGKGQDGSDPGKGEE